jgi:ABC-2 type transport system ATP-binding protein
MKAIEVYDLTRQYDGLRAVDGISFSVEPGEIFGFLGPNGAGKTTTIRMLTGQLLPTSGTAKVAGYDIVTERQMLKPKIGVVFDSQNLYERMSARENLIFYARLYRIERSRVFEILSQVGLTQRAGDKVMKYSNGMKQRLLIARALLHKPEVLFLDEPTRGLDPLCQRVAFLDQGHIVALDSPERLKAEHGQDEKTTLEDIFILLTGSDLRQGSEDE